MSMKQTALLSVIRLSKSEYSWPMICKVTTLTLQFVIAQTLLCAAGNAQDFVSVDQSVERDTLLKEKTKFITSVIRDAAAANWGDSELVNARWIKAVESSMGEFQVLATRIDRRHLVNKYIEQFGTGDDLADFAILVSLGRHGVPSQSADCGLASQQGDRFNEEVDFYRNQQLLVAECQCRRFLKSRESLKRYAHFLVWSGFLNRDSWRQYKSTAAASISTDEYWWHARNALVLMEISGRLPETAIEPGGIKFLFEPWLAEVSEFDVELPESRSLKSPFPTWKERTPIPGSEFRSIYDRRILLIVD